MGLDVLCKAHLHNEGLREPTKSQGGMLGYAPQSLPHPSALLDAATTLRRTRGRSGEDFKLTGLYKVITTKFGDSLLSNCAPHPKEMQQVGNIIPPNIPTNWQ